MLGLVVSGHAKSITKGEDASFVKDDVVWRVPRHAYCANPADVRPPFPSHSAGRTGSGQSDGQRVYTEADVADISATAEERMAVCSTRRLGRRQSDRSDRKRLLQQDEHP